MPELHNSAPSVLASLRRLTPAQRISPRQALLLAERQAIAFRTLTHQRRARLDISVLEDLPHVRISKRKLPSSGLSYWSGTEWVICVNRDEPSRRQRFTAFHEYKHVIDHGLAHITYVDYNGELAELAAEYFAGCVLVPRDLLLSAWEAGCHDIDALARRFSVSTRAIAVRLAQVGLTHRVPHPRRLGRQLSIGLTVTAEPLPAQPSEMEAAA